MRGRVWQLPNVGRCWHWSAPMSSSAGASCERREQQGDGRRPDSDSLPPQAATHSEGKGGGRRPAGPLRLP